MLRKQCRTLVQIANLELRYVLVILPANWPARRNEFSSPARIYASWGISRAGAAAHGRRRHTLFALHVETNVTYAGIGLPRLALVSIDPRRFSRVRTFPPYTSNVFVPNPFKSVAAFSFGREINRNFDSLPAFRVSTVRRAPSLLSARFPSSSSSRSSILISTGVPPLSARLLPRPFYLRFSSRSFREDQLNGTFYRRAKRKGERRETVKLTGPRQAGDSSHSRRRICRSDARFASGYADRAYPIFSRPATVKLPVRKYRVDARADAHSPLTNESEETRGGNRAR